MYYRKLAIVCVVLLTFASGTAVAQDISDAQSSQVVEEKGNIIGSKQVVNYTLEDGTNVSRVENKGLWQLDVFRPNTLSTTDEGPQPLLIADPVQDHSPGDTVTLTATHENTWSFTTDFQVAYWIEDSSGNVVIGTDASGGITSGQLELYTEPGGPATSVNLDSGESWDFSRSQQLPDESGTYTIHYSAQMLYSGDFIEDESTTQQLTIESTTAPTPTPTDTVEPTPTQTPEEPRKQPIWENIVQELWGFFRGFL